MKTVNSILVAVALLVSPLAAHAEGKFAIGPQGGVVFPNFNVQNQTPASTWSNKNGWMGGIFAEFGVWAITLRPEINYVQKGYSVAGLADVKNQYVEIPALVKINPLGSLPASPFIVLGPQWSKQVSSSVSTVPGQITFTDTNTNWDISGVAGVGLDVNFSEHVALEVQGRYSLGFRNVNTSTTQVKMRDFYTIAGLAIQSPF